MIAGGRSLVMFSCAEADFWWARSFMQSLDDAVLISHRPLVRPLVTMLDSVTQDAHRVVDHIITAAHKQQNAVIGLVETLAAVQSGRAQQIVMVDGFAQSAFRYSESGHIVLDLEDADVLGSGQMQALPDAVDSVLRHALLQGIDITVVAEHEELRAAGSIAARTRY